MALYTRKDYERDLAEYDALRCEATRTLLAGCPIDKRKIDEILDEAELKAKRRLVSTGLIISDRQKMRRSSWFAWVWWKKAPEQHKLWRNGHLGEVSKQEIRRLARSGVMLFATNCKLCGGNVGDSGEGMCSCETIFLKRGGRKKRTSEAEPQTAREPERTWVEVTHEQAKVILALGGNTWTCPSGKLDDHKILSQDTELLPATSSVVAVPPTSDTTSGQTSGSQSQTAGA